MPFDRKTELINRLRTVDAQVQRLSNQMDWVIGALHRVLNTERQDMVSIAELQAKADETLARVTAEQEVSAAIKVVVEHQNSAIAALKQQVADLIAAGGADQSALQSLMDTMSAAESLDMANAAKVAEAVVAGTPAEVPPADGGSGNGGTVSPPTSTDPELGVQE